MAFLSGATNSRQSKMTIFDLDKSISVEFHGGVDVIEKKMLGLWVDERLKSLKTSIGMKLVNENVVVIVSDIPVVEIPFPVFERLATVEVADIIISKIEERFK